MKARIVRIGNSRGIRIPKPLIEQTGLGDDVEIVVQGNALVISPVGRTRAGWVDAFRAMAAHGDDELQNLGSSRAGSISITAEQFINGETNIASDLAKQRW